MKGRSGVALTQFSSSSSSRIACYPSLEVVLSLVCCGLCSSWLHWAACVLYYIAKQHYRRDVPILVPPPPNVCMHCRGSLGRLPLLHAACCPTCPLSHFLHPPPQKNVLMCCRLCSLWFIGRLVCFTTSPSSTALAKAAGWETQG